MKEWTAPATTAIEGADSGLAHPHTRIIEELEQEWEAMLLVGGQKEGTWSYTEK